MQGSGGRAWLDGRLVAIDEPHLRLTDRGFQLGDGIFETLRARRGVAIELTEHLVRLHESAHALGLRLPFDDQILTAAIRELLAAEGLAADGLDGRPVGDAALRITISRGPLPGRGLLPPDEAPAPTVAIQAWPYAPPPARLLREGLAAIISSLRRDPASPLAGIKSTSRADHVYARLEASHANVDDAILLTFDGRLAESTAANLWVVRRGQVLTPPSSAGVLAGTTRTWLLAQRDLPGLRVAEADLRPEDLLAGEEAFLSASVSGIVPLTRLDGQAIGDGRPGASTLTLRERREGWVDEVARQAVPGAGPGSATRDGGAADGGATDGGVADGPRRLHLDSPR